MLAPAVLFSFVSACLPGSLQDPEDPVQRALGRARLDFERSRELWPDHSSWESPWRVTSGHYQVTTTRSYHFGRSAGQALEQMLGYFVDLLGRLPAEDVVFPVEIHPDLPSYNAIGNALQDADAYHSSSYGSVVPLGFEQRPLITYDLRSDDHLYRFLTHGAMHQYLAQCFPDARPLWIEEGLASYFTMFWDGTFGDRHTLPFQNMVRDGRFISLRPLLALTADQVSSDYFVELAMLFHYLLALRDDTRTVWDEDGNVVKAPFRDYLRKSLAGQDLSADPVHDLFRNRIDELERDFRGYPFGG